MTDQPFRACNWPNGPCTNPEAKDDMPTDREKALRDVLRAILEDIRTRDAGIRYETMQQAFAALAAQPAEPAAEPVATDAIRRKVLALDRLEPGIYRGGLTMFPQQPVDNGRYLRRADVLSALNVSEAAPQAERAAEPVAVVGKLGELLALPGPALQPGTKLYAPKEPT